MRYIVGLLAAAAVVAWAVTSAAAAEPRPPVKPSPAIEAIAKANNAFAFDLYQKLRKNEGNLFFSPTSISTALAMTYAGAEGETETQMAKTLRLTLPEAQVHPAYASLMQSLTGAGKPYELRIANRLWGQKGFGFLPKYLAVTRTEYGAELAQVDFVNQTEAVRAEINAWVEKQTNDKIKDLIPSGALDNMTRLVLTNAIYFKGKWEHQFAKESTVDQPFTTAGGQKVQAPLMYIKEDFRYGETPDAQVIELPYKGGDLSMVVLLPKKIDGLAALEAKLSGEALVEWTRAMRKIEVYTYLPRFKLTEEFQLNSALSELGMPSAFDPSNANFSGMDGKRDLYITAALHKAFVDVNEEGTEAAAATGIVVGVTSAPLDPKVFKADHPFVFMIRDNRSGSVLFLGRVVNPKG